MKKECIDGKQHRGVGGQRNIGRYQCNRVPGRDVVNAVNTGAKGAGLFQSQ